MSDGHISDYRKADIAFLKAYQIERNYYNIEIGIHIVIALTFIIFIPIDAKLLQTGDKIIPAQAVALGTALFSILAWTVQRYLRFTQPGIIGYCQLARDTLHATEEVIVSGQSEQSCTSQTILDAGSGVQVAGLPQKTINVFARMTRFQIRQAFEVKYSLPCWQKMEYFGGITAMIVVVILMSTSDHMNAAQITILICYLVLQAYSKWIFIVILILFALSPLLCLVLCVFLCCCVQQQAQLGLDLQPQAATTDHVVKCDGECSICLMNINPGEPIYQLPCSDKHIFHKGCMDKWASVKQTCPICRKELPKKEISRDAPEQPGIEPQE